MTIITMWIKDNTVKISMGKSLNVFTKNYDSKKDAENGFDKMKKLFAEKGEEIKIGDPK